MKLTVRERVFNVLYSASSPMTGGEILKELKKDPACSKVIQNTINTSIRALNKIDGCEIVLKRKGYSYTYEMISTASYIELKPLSIPSLLIDTMWSNGGYMTAIRAYNSVRAKGGITNKEYILRCMLKFAFYNGCKIVSKKDGTTMTYKMMSKPIFPYTKKNKKEVIVEVEIESEHCRSSVDLLFRSDASGAIKQNKRMIEDSRR